VTAKDFVGKVMSGSAERLLGFFSLLISKLQLFSDETPHFMEGTITLRYR
jgi:hypothetical protein